MAGIHPIKCMLSTHLPGQQTKSARKYPYFSFQVRQYVLLHFLKSTRTNAKSLQYAGDCYGSKDSNNI